MVEKIKETMSERLRACVTCPIAKKIERYAQAGQDYSLATALAKQQGLYKEGMNGDLLEHFGRTAQTIQIGCDRRLLCKTIGAVVAESMPVNRQNHFRNLHGDKGVEGLTGWYHGTFFFRGVARTRRS